MRLFRQFLHDERGYGTLMLALIGVIFASMLVIPYLAYVQASLLSVRKAGEGLGGLSCGSAGVEHALWRLGYDQAFTDSLTPQNPSASYSIDCDGDQVPITVTLQPQPSPLPDYLTEYVYADIVLVADASGSISSSEMEVFKEAAHAIVDGFYLHANADRYRIGLSRFAIDSDPVVDVSDADNELTDPPENHFAGVPLHDGIDNLTDGLFWWDRLGTNIVAGIDGGAAQYATGLGDRPGIPNLMVFMTDGDDTEGNTITDIENASAASGARIFAVGVDDVFVDTLYAIASEPDEDHVFYSSDFQGLLDLIDDIVAAVTQGGAAGSLYDIEVTAPDGTTIRVRALLTLDGELAVISLQEV